MNDMKIFNSNEFGDIRTDIHNGEPMFCLSDVCKALGLTQPSKVKERLNEKGVRTIPKDAIEMFLYIITQKGWKGHGYANGGFPKVGEMFYARESGPELVGKIGNRSAVVNNQQIVDSVSNGVSRANDETNSLLRTIIEYQELLLKKETSVNMDGKRMDKQISKARRNTGFSFSPT